MLMLDSVSNLTLGVEEVCGLDRSRVSNAVAFRKFAGGMRLEKDFLLNDRWANLPQVTSPVAMYGVIMHEMLPVSYDAAWLEGLGGHFSIRISGIGDYTLIALNRRVVTLSGLPVDHDSNAETIDLEIAPEVLQAYCRGLLLDIADEVLDAEDEFEDREISGAELLLNGMPSGGYSTVEMSSDFGSARNRKGSLSARRLRR